MILTEMFYGMEVHMNDIKSIEELPWHGKLELIK